jgi:hypothetical protein
MSLTTDERLTSVYKNMFGLDNIDNTSGNTTLQGDVIVTSSFDIIKDSILVQNTTLLSTLYVSNNTILNNSTSILSSFYTSNLSTLYSPVIANNNVLINNKLDVVNNFYCSNNTILNKETTMLSTLNISNTATFKNNIITNNLLPINDKIDIIGNVINIGSTNSVIKMFGTSLYVATNELKLKDKMITLNIDANNINAFDNGSMSGIYICGNQGDGFIKTSEDGKKFKIKSPADSNIKYISVTDSTNETFNISGNTTLYQPTTFCSSIYVSNYTNLLGSTTFLSALIVS